MIARRPARAVLTTPWGQSLVEALLLVVVMGFLFLVTGLDEATVRQGLLLLGPVGALWFAFRLRRPQGGLRRRLMSEVRDGAALSTAVGLTLIVIASLNLTSLFPGREQTHAGAAFTQVLQSLDGFLLFFGTACAWMAFRIAALIWATWDRLRRKHLVWDLTNALLTVAMGVGFVFLLAGSLFYAQTYLIPEFAALSENSIARVLHGLVLSAPALVTALLLTVLCLPMLLPPFALFSYVVARHVTRRLQALAVGTRALRLGHLDTRIKVTSTDEVGQLQEDFNAMAEQLAANLREIQAERDRNAALLQERRELIASVSHELRTPVATAQSYLESTLSSADATLSPELRHDLEVVQHEVGRLHHLIDDLLALAQTEAGRLSLACAPVDACALVRQVVETMAPLAWNGGRVQVCAETPVDPVIALADTARLQQILVNLLHNAIRHTPPGGIVVADVYASGESTIVRVRDTGAGIAPIDLDRIWERFYRCETPNENGQAGSGLGLALVKELTEAMGGAVSVSSPAWARAAPSASRCPVFSWGLPPTRPPLSSPPRLSATTLRHICSPSATGLW
ncbi:MAG: sensor histidine kinase [Anaerolineae bacterium]